MKSITITIHCKEVPALLKALDDIKESVTCFEEIIGRVGISFSSSEDEYSYKIDSEALHEETEAA